MTLAAGDFLALLLAVGLLLGAAHAVGHLFTLARQPRVIGEIMGGLLLGPTVLGALAPELQATLFPSEGPVAAVLGLELPDRPAAAHVRPRCRDALGLPPRRDTGVGLVTVVGVVLPFVAGLLLFRVIDSSSLLGVAQNDTALLLVFGLAIAVTSIPVISRIMFDLGIIETPFARIVLGVAVIEDIIVYVVLLSPWAWWPPVEARRWASPACSGWSRAARPAWRSTSAGPSCSSSWCSPWARAASWSRRQRWNLVASSNPIAYHLLFIFGGTLVCVMLGITPMFGAFLAGIAASIGRGPQVTQARESIKSFSFAFFIPSTSPSWACSSTSSGTSTCCSSPGSSCRLRGEGSQRLPRRTAGGREPAGPAPRGGPERPRRPRHRARVGELRSGDHQPGVLCCAGDAGHRDVAARRLLAGPRGAHPPTPARRAREPPGDQRGSARG